MPTLSKYTLLFIIATILGSSFVLLRTQNKLLQVIMSDQLPTLEKITENNHDCQGLD
jgi:hypothetical protein